MRVVRAIQTLLTVLAPAPELVLVLVLALALVLVLVLVLAPAPAPELVPEQEPALAHNQYLVASTDPSRPIEPRHRKHPLPH